MKDDVSKRRAKIAFSIIYILSGDQKIKKRLVLFASVRVSECLRLFFRRKDLFSVLESLRANYIVEGRK